MSKCVFIFIQTKMHKDIINTPTKKNITRDYHIIYDVFARFDRCVCVFEQKQKKNIIKQFGKNEIH